MIPWQGLDKVLTKYDPAFRTGATCPNYTRRSRQRFCQVTWGEIVPSLDEDLCFQTDESVDDIIASWTSVGLNLNSCSGVSVIWTTRQQWPQQSNWTSITSRQSLSSWIQSSNPFIASQLCHCPLSQGTTKTLQTLRQAVFHQYKYKSLWKSPPQSTVWSQLSFGIIFLDVDCCEIIFSKVPRLT